MTAQPSGHVTREPSHLFYQTRLRRPLVDRAEGIHLWDRDGRRYLDGSSGAMVCGIGHGNARVLDAMRAQMQRATFAYRLQFENEPAERLAARLAALAPADLDRVFFVSGGSEAVESCLKLARQHAIARGEGERYKVISCYPSYHGSTLGALSVTGYTALSAPFSPMMRQMPQVPAPRSYLEGRHRSEPENAAHYAAALEAEIGRQGPETCLAFIVEPVGGASTGALVPPAGYLARVREICERHGMLLIFDEVMTGAGRTGRFLASEHSGVVPDLVALSKGLAAGYSPLGAMLAPRRVVEPVLNAGGFLHGYTYAGNPLACAAGLAVLEEIEDRGLVDNAAAMGGLLAERLAALGQRFPFIGDVRGLGLLQALELVADADTLAPLPAARNAGQRLSDLAYERGLIVYPRRTRGGREGDHVMVAPPLIVDEAGIDELVTLLAEALEAFAAELEHGNG